MENTTNNNYEQTMRDAQYRKSRSIAFFSATNAAIEMLKIRIPYSEMQIENTDEGKKKTLIYWREFFLDEYTKDYVANVATIGLSVSPAVKEGLDKAKQAYEG